MNNQKSRDSERQNWIIWATAFTVIYIVFFIGCILGISRVWEFLISSHDLNQIGDFVAGMFAPLALIWLMAAVLTQRQELEDARAQFEASQLIIGAQLDAVKSQAMRTYKLDLFNYRFEMYTSLYAISQDPNRFEKEKGYDQTLAALSRRSQFLFGPEVPERLGLMSKNMMSIFQLKDSIDNFSEVFFDPSTETVIARPDGGKTLLQHRTGEYNRRRLEMDSLFFDFDKVLRSYLDVKEADKEDAAERVGA